MLGMLIEAHAADRLQFFADHQHLAESSAFKAYLAPLWKTDWFVYAKPPFAGSARQPICPHANKHGRDTRDCQFPSRDRSSGLTMLVLLPVAERREPLRSDR
jgi:hypothetical protein